MSTFNRFGRVSLFLVTVTVTVSGSLTPAQEPQQPQQPALNLLLGSKNRPLPFNPVPGGQVPFLPPGWVFGPFNPEAPHELYFVSPDGQTNTLQFGGTISVFGGNGWFDGLPTYSVYDVRWIWDPVRQVGLIKVTDSCYYWDVDRWESLLFPLDTYYGPYSP